MAEKRPQTDEQVPFRNRPRPGPGQEGARMLTINQIAKLLQISERHARQLLAEDHFPIPDVKIGARRRFRLVDVERYLNGEEGSQSDAHHAAPCQACPCPTSPAPPRLARLAKPNRAAPTQARLTVPDRSEATGMTGHRRR